MQANAIDLVYADQYIYLDLKLARIRCKIHECEMIDGEKKVN